MKRAAIILAEGFEEIEALTPVDLLRRAGISVQIVGLESSQITGARGVLVTADILFHELDSELDVVILPGGMPGSRNLAKHKGLQDLLLKRNKEKKLLAAICAAPALVFGSLGILHGKKYTCYPGMESKVEGGQYSTEAVVKDGNILTSRGVGTAILFSLEIIRLLLGDEKSRDVSRDCLIHG